MKTRRTAILVALLLVSTGYATAGRETTVGKVLVHVPTFQPEEDCGWMRFFGALTSVLRHQGEDVDYAYLIGVSGAAFRLKIHPDWCPSAQDPAAEEGIYPAQALLALGYTGNFVHGPAVGEAQCLRLMREQIDRGIPVVVSGAAVHPAPDFSSVVTGYEEENRFHFFSYCHKKQEYDETTGDKLIGDLLLVRKVGVPLTPLGALRRSFQLALKMATTRELNGYAHGFAAYDGWIKRLRQKEGEFTKLDEKELKAEWWRNAMNYEGLCDARGAARRYLVRVQSELPDGTAAKLRPVVEKYERIQKLVFENWKWFPFPGWVKEEQGKIWTPLGMIDGTAWSPQIRQKEVEALEAIVKAERDASDLMARFLKETEP